ncbi:MAG: hypothetical protein SFV18_06050 [Bryobacteraceae bacterium]|nr:hypothetical protein [Bryobacteraceae bacterium]
MASLTVRNLEESVKTRLRVRAAQRGRSMEEEAREILRNAVGEAESPGISLADSIRSRIEPLGGVELTLPARQKLRQPPRFR